MRKTIALLLSFLVLLLGQAEAKLVEYYHLDALGSVRAVTDARGRLVERHDYLPFGEEWKPPLPRMNQRRFTGKERDRETGFDYFGARYYSAEVGRFTSVDPATTLEENLLDPQRWNRYAYGRNNPLRYADPDGRIIDTIADIAFIGYDLFDIGRSLLRGEGISGTQLGALGTDVVAAAIPLATGAGFGVRAAAKAEHAATEAARAGEALVTANRARGLESEARILRELAETKSTGEALRA